MYTSYRSASSSLSARRPPSCFDVDNEEANARENVVVADGHADVRASAAMTDDNDDDTDDGDFDGNLGEISGDLSTATPSLDFDRFLRRRLQRRPRSHSPSLYPLLPPSSPPLSSFSGCCWGALLRSRSSHYRISKIHHL